MPEPAAEVRMSFGEHLDELRKRLWKSLLVLSLSFCVALCFYKKMIYFFAKPHLRAMAMLNVPPEQSKFLSGSYTQPWGTVFKLAFIVGAFVASPVVAYQMWKFIGAGLYARERRWALTFGPASFFLFAGGCIFGYVVLIPYALYGLSSGLSMDVMSPAYTFSDYLDLVMKLTIVMGAIFELPLVMFFLAKIGLASATLYNKWRRYAIVGNFILAAFLSPPDVVSMLVMVVPLLVLYEIGVLLSWIFVRKPKPTIEAVPATHP